MEHFNTQRQPGEYHGDPEELLRMNIPWLNPMPVETVAAIHDSLREPTTEFILAKAAPQLKLLEKGEARPQDVADLAYTETRVQVVFLAIKLALMRHGNNLNDVVEAIDEASDTAVAIYFDRKYQPLFCEADRMSRHNDVHNSEWDALLAEIEVERLKALDELNDYVKHLTLYFA